MCNRSDFYKIDLYHEIEKMVVPFVHHYCCASTWTSIVKVTFHKYKLVLSSSLNVVGDWGDCFQLVFLSKDFI